MAVPIRQLITELPPQVHPLPPELNERASRLIIGSFAMHPLGWDSGWLAADKVMENTVGDSPDRRPLSVGILALAAIQPDPERCAEVINRIHQANGIPYELDELEAGEVVLRGALSALERVRTTTVGYVNRVGGEAALTLPPDVRKKIYEPNADDSSKEVFDRLPALQLHEYLVSNRQPRTAVAAIIRGHAVRVKKRARAWRNQVKDEYRKALQEADSQV